MSTDWGAWSREAVQLMQQRNAAWQSRHDLGSASYRWNLDEATIRFESDGRTVIADAILVGTVSRSERSFEWSWANPKMPSAHRARTAAVREFGARYGLAMLTNGHVPGGRAEALEALAIAGRILDADGVFLDESGDLTLCFALFGFHEAPSP